MKGIFENFPAANSFDGRSGMTSPSITGTNKFDPPVSVSVVAACAQDAINSEVLALWRHENESPSAVSAHSDTPAVKLSHASLRREAL